MYRVEIPEGDITEVVVLMVVGSVDVLDVVCVVEVVVVLCVGKT